MAKYGVTNITGGGGIGSDEVSVTKEYVLDGKTYVGADTDDEIGTGKMANNGTTANQNLNADSSYYIKKGYHEKDFTVIANSLASQTSATALTNEMISGKTAWVNGKKITGTIPIQNSDTDGDRVWATNASNWAGTFNIGVRNGYYLNGVNWVRYDVPTYRPENIKKGVNIGGVIGTWEGWVPQPTDLYYRGNNIAQFSLSGGSSAPSFQSGGIRVPGGGEVQLNTPYAYNMDSYNYINIEVYFETQTNYRLGNFRQYGFGAVYYKQGDNASSTAGLYRRRAGGGDNQSYTITIPLTNTHYTSRFNLKVGFSGEYFWTGDNDEGWSWVNEGQWRGWIYRIWFS